MGEISWVQFKVDMFNSKKIKFIRKNIPEGNDVVLIWSMLICEAGKCNFNGYVFLTENLPYSDEMLASELDFPINTIRLALETFKRLDMIEMDNKGILLKGFLEHQNGTKLELIREQNRIRKQNQRLKVKGIESPKNDANTEKIDNCEDENYQYFEFETVTNLSRDSHVTCHNENAKCHAAEIEIELELDKELNNNTFVKFQTESNQKNSEDKSSEERVPYDTIKDLFNQICYKLPKIRDITNKRKRRIRAAWHNNSNLDYFTELFKKVAESNFLNGINDNAWSASFDWVMNDSNSIKILEDNYKNKDSPKNRNLSNISQHNNYDKRNYEDVDFEKYYANVNNSG